jgi:hypothetical protein
VYVVFDNRQLKHATKNRGTFDPDDPNILFQPHTDSFEAPRGAIELQGMDGPAVITMLQNADPSTAVHEASHHFLAVMKQIGEHPDGPVQIVDDWKIVKNWWRLNKSMVATEAGGDVRMADIEAVLENGSTGDEVKDRLIDRAFHETWARAFERYLIDGIAPTKGLKKVFESFKNWLVSIYKQASELGADISPELRGVFDRMLTPEERTKFVGGISIARNDYVPDDFEMATLNTALIEAAASGGKSAAQAVSTEGHYGGVERSVDLTVLTNHAYNPNPLWAEMKRVAREANQDSVFLAREVPESADVDLLMHRPGVEITFPKRLDRAELEAQLRVLADNGFEYLTVTASGEGVAPGAMGRATGVRILAMPEFEGLDLTGVDDAQLAIHMRDRTSTLIDQARDLEVKNPGLKARVTWYDADVAFRSDYANANASGTDRGAGAPAGEAAWRGRSIREAVEAADRNRAASGKAQEAAPGDVRGSDPAEPQRVVATDATRPREVAAPAPRELAELPENIEPTLFPEDPPIEGLEEASAAVGKEEGLDELAEILGVNPESGAFDENFDLQQIKREGRLSEEDEALMREMDVAVENAQAYAKALEAARACVT